MHVYCMWTILLTKHVFRYQVVLIVRRAHLVKLVGGGTSECVIVLWVSLRNPPNLKPILVSFPLVVMTLIELCSIHESLLVRHVCLIDARLLHRLLVQWLLVVKPLLPLVLVLVYAYVYSSVILGGGRLVLVA